MINFEASSPQLSLVKKWLESYISRDTKNTDPLLSKNFQYESYPKSPSTPNQSKEAHLKLWGTGLSSMTKLETTTREVVEAPGKVVVLGDLVFHTPGEAKFSYDVVVILTLVEEDGELKILNCKSFADAEKRNAVFAWAADQARAQGEVAS